MYGGRADERVGVARCRPRTTFHRGAGAAALPLVSLLLLPLLPLLLLALLPPPPPLLLLPLLLAMPPMPMLRLVLGLLVLGRPGQPEPLGQPTTS